MLLPMLMTPVVYPELDTFLKWIRESLSRGFQPFALFGTCEAFIYCLMGKAGELELACCPFPPAGRYPSLSIDFPAFQIFERELFEEYGIVPIRHPWLKSVRHPVNTQPAIEDYPFLASESPLIHEVGVGPVHAGVIEPGHFRFLMRGEIVEHLEIQLGWQHRGICAMLCDGALAQKMYIAESIAGDSVIAHGTAFCGIVECLSGTEARAKHIRTLLLEMERVAMHLSTLSALAGDVAYIMSQNLFAAIRTTVINSTLSICGSRFGKRALCPGGVNYALTQDLIEALKTKMKYCALQIQNTAEAMFASTSLLSRFDDTGKVSTEDVIRYGFTGISAKASGVPIDSRVDFPNWQYPAFLVQTESTGDVFARAHLRYVEAMQSLDIIQELLKRIDPQSPICTETASFSPNQIAVSIVEGARGRVLHIAKSKDESTALWYKIYDPSMVNWLALSLAVQDEQVSDFPLCNKSFDLSYCGSDL